MPLRQFTRSEVEAHAHKHDAMVIIDNAVYDVTRFLEEHPGGADVLLANAGRDASQCFHDVGHSQEARQLRRRYLAGEVVEAERRPEWSAVAPPAPADQPPSLAGVLHVFAPPLALAAAAVLLYTYLFS